jgi:hypothetical protein
MLNKKYFMFFVLVLAALFLTIVSATRLPTVGGDEDSWGSVLNDFLSRIAGDDATELNLTMVNGKNIYSSAINTTHILDGTITSADLGTGSVGDDEIDYSEVTLADFTNDANYLDKDEGGIIDGSLILNGNFTLIGSYLNATVTNQYLNGSFFPSMDNIFDIGSASRRWRDLYLGGDAVINGNIDVNDGTLFVDSANNRVGIGTASPSSLFDVEGTLGDNSIVNGVFDADSDWSKGAGWSITGGVAVGTAATGNLNEIVSTVVANKFYKLQFDLTATSGNIYVRAGGWSSRSPISSTGTYTLYFHPVSTAAVTFDGNAAFTGTIDNVVLTEVLSTYAFDNSYLALNNQPLIINENAAGEHDIIKIATNSGSNFNLYSDASGNIALENLDKHFYIRQLASGYTLGLSSVSSVGILSSTVGLVQSSNLAAGNYLGISTGTYYKSLTDTDNRQAYVYIQPRISQSGTAAYDAIYVDVTEISLGNGSTGDGNNLLNLAVGGTSLARVSNTGQGYFAGNVGIGTATPQNTLNVIGDVNATSGFVVGANTGITDTSSYWLCTASDCSSTCQVQINGGIITGCT